MRHTLTDLWRKVLGDLPVPPDVIERDSRWFEVEHALDVEQQKQDEAAERGRG